MLDNKKVAALGINISEVEAEYKDYIIKGKHYEDEIGISEVFYDHKSKRIILRFLDEKKISHGLSFGSESAMILFLMIGQVADDAGLFQK